MLLAAAGMSVHFTPGKHGVVLPACAALAEQPSVSRHPVAPVPEKP